jgi:hypothetical protein
MVCSTIGRQNLSFIVVIVSVTTCSWTARALRDAMMVNKPYLKISYHQTTTLYHTTSSTSSKHTKSELELKQVDHDIRIGNFMNDDLQVCYANAQQRNIPSVVTLLAFNEANNDLHVISIGDSTAAAKCVRIFTNTIDSERAHTSKLNVLLDTTLSKGTMLLLYPPLLKPTTKPFKELQYDNTTVYSLAAFVTDFVDNRIIPCVSSVTKAVSATQTKADTQMQRCLSVKAVSLSTVVVVVVVVCAAVVIAAVLQRMCN